MLLIALITLTAVWGTVVTIVLGLCISAARGDRELRDRGDSAQTAPNRRLLRLVAS